MKGNSANNYEVFLKFIILPGAAMAIGRPGRPKS